MRSEVSNKDVAEILSEKRRGFGKRPLKNESNGKMHEKHRGEKKRSKEGKKKSLREPCKTRRGHPEKRVQLPKQGQRLVLRDVSSDARQKNSREVAKSRKQGFYKKTSCNRRKLRKKI